MTSLKNSLINRAEKLLVLAEQVQKEPPPNEEERKEIITEISTLYRVWYHEALNLLSSRPDLQKDFMKEHDGGLINSGIKGFY